MFVELWPFDVPKNGSWIKLYLLLGMYGCNCTRKHLDQCSLKTFTTINTETRSICYGSLTSQYFYEILHLGHFLSDFKG